ncbi:DUF29 domain-containing protein [Aphanothece hegewaldii CCALA 016]|uniref:DUF29 domain-containing protein n=1 Tax=Aphanothece hegewaldii CCALA 016 TaxID=2107694 RepID=A0A2T1M2P2_9CHRO|nr:DUF29 domain-containing protein [Aphanothece hegewaldii]PSF39024.1 DUF29 domain-containing protein [Aphanothece hegewaldii CCALA 016]
MSQTLYEQDFQLWIEQTIASLKNRDFDALDIDHLIEELADLGQSEKISLESNLIILLAHLLKLKVQQNVPHTMKSKWYESINEHRLHIEKNLQNSPSFKSSFDTAIQSAYPNARKLAIKDSQNAILGVSIPKADEYPQTCPFSVEQILDEDFYGLENN